MKLLLVAIALAWCSLAMPAPAPADSIATHPMPVPALPQEIVDLAIQQPLTRHNRSIKGGAHTNMGHIGEAPVVLAMAAMAGNTTADARLLEQMRYTIAGGNDITA